MMEFRSSGQQGSAASPEPPSHRLQLAVREDWLALTQEDILDPAAPIVDAHHHLWQRDNPLHGYAYGVKELAADAANGHRVVASVFVEGAANYRQGSEPGLAPVGETEYVVRSAGSLPADSPFNACAGIVGHVDLRLEARVRPALEAHIAAGGGRFRGIRQISAWHGDPAVKGTVHRPPPGLLRDAAFRRGFAHLAPLGLSFDAWLYFTQLDELIELADAFPDTTIIIDHAGGLLGVGEYAHRQAEAFAAWQGAIENAARRPNVHVKLSGLGMRITGWNLHERRRPASSVSLEALWRPRFDACIEAFGPDRCMFASNFPVDKSAVSYGVLWNAHKRIAARYAPSHRHALLCATAQRVYRLQADGASA